MALDAKDLAHDLTMKVVVTRYNQWRIRMIMGFWLIRLASWIMWINIEIIEEVEVADFE